MQSAALLFILTGASATPRKASSNEESKVLRVEVTPIGESNFIGAKSVGTEPVLREFGGASGADANSFSGFSSSYSHAYSYSPSAAPVGAVPHAYGYSPSPSTHSYSSYHGNGHYDAGDSDCWDFSVRYIDPASVNTELTYPKADTGLPECLQGLWWMDQLALTWHSGLVDLPLGSFVYGREATEYTTSVSSWDGRCITFGRCNRWLMGRVDAQIACMGSPTFCSSSSSVNDPCAVGEKFTVEQAWYHNGEARTLSIIRTTWGWERESCVGWGPCPTYPLVKIVDGYGQKLAMFDMFLSEANGTFECNPFNYVLQTCPRNTVLGGNAGVCYR